MSEVAGESYSYMCTMSKEDCHILSCRHKFHTKCIQEWFTHNPTCPFIEQVKLIHKLRTLEVTVGALVAIGFIGGLVAFLIFISEISSSLIWNFKNYSHMILSAYKVGVDFGAVCRNILPSQQQI